MWRDGGHTYSTVYAEMLLQVTLEYTSLGDPMLLTVPQIVFFYDGIRGTLKKRTTPE